MFGGASEISVVSSGVDDLEQRLNALNLELTDEQVLQLWQEQHEEFLDLHQTHGGLIDNTMNSKCEPGSVHYRVFKETSFSVEEKRKYLSFREEVLDAVNLFLLMPYFYDKVPTTLQKTKDITRVPDAFFTHDPDFIKNLRVLKLGSNRIRKVSSKISLAMNLIELDLQHNDLRHVPVEVFNLIRLRTLRLNNNRLTYLPDQLDRLVNLTGLYLYQNKLSASMVPQGVLANSNLVSLYFFQSEKRKPANGLDHILLREAWILITNKADIINKMAQINCELKSSVERLLTELEKLFLSENSAENNCLSEMDACIRKLNSIIITSRIDDEAIALDCDHAHVTRFYITEEDRKKHSAFWDKVRYVNLCHNHLRSFDGSAVPMPALQGLFLADNILETVPNCVGFPLLSSLNLCFNQLRNLPRGSYFPAGLEKLQSNKLFFSFNPLPAELLNKVGKPYTVANGLRLKDQPHDKLAAQWEKEAASRRKPY